MLLALSVCTLRPVDFEQVRIERKVLGHTRVGDRQLRTREKSIDKLLDHFIVCVIGIVIRRIADN